MNNENATEGGEQEIINPLTLIEEQTGEKEKRLVTLFKLGICKKLRKQGL